MVRNSNTKEPNDPFPYTAPYIASYIYKTCRTATATITLLLFCLLPFFSSD